MNDTILCFNKISRSFPGVKALDSVSFDCQKAEVHAVIGENGAGKSTLMKVLAGVYPPDSGQLIWNDNAVNFSGPRDAQSHGISIIYQELDLISYMSLAENIALGREPLTSWNLIDRRTIEHQAHKLMHQLGVNLDVRTPVYRLGVAHQQLGEIAKALSVDAALIIMDEPTASLAQSEVEKLFEIIALLKSRGVTILYVSHRLEEIFSIADRVTVLKDGVCQGTFSVRDTSRAELIRLMVGRQLSEIFPARGNQKGEVVLEVRGMARPPKLQEASFQVHAGEVLGIGGLVGSGRTELARCIFGADIPERGEVWVRGDQILSGSPRQAAQRGLAFVTEDRKSEGLVLGLSIRENIALPSLSARQYAGFIQVRNEQSLVRSYLQQLNIRTQSPEREVQFLSGGNQQKVVLAKWLAREPDVLIFDEPTRGIDVGAKAELYEIIREMARQGKAIVLISSDLPELLGMSDRILVMRDGRVNGILEAEGATEEAVLHIATSGSDEGDRGKYDSDRDTATGIEDNLSVRPIYKRRNLLSYMRENSNLVAISGALAFLLIFSMSVSEPFRSFYNLMNILRQGMALGLVSIGQTFVLLAGGIDLSVGSVITLANLFSAGMMDGSNVLILPVALFCLALGAGVGMVNGALVVYLRIPAFVATLGTMIIGRGIALIYARGPVGSVSKAYRWIADGSIGPIPAPAFIWLVVLVLGIIFLRSLRTGHYHYAVGGNPDSARLSGIPVKRIQLIAFSLCGAMAAATGLFLSSRMGSGDPTIGPGFELDSITAAIVGGTILGGGRGGLIGTIMGVFLVGILNNVLNLLDVASWYQQIIKGMILLLAVSVYRKNN